MTIALLLGSFNPIHNGHLAIARYVIEAKLADQVWFVVSPQNPFKQSSELAPFNHRVAMAELAVAQIANGTAYYRVCDIENRLPCPSYTINTIRALANLYPHDDFTILCGSDILEHLDRWHESQELQQISKFLVYPRSKGVASPQMANAPQFDIAATDLRKMICDRVNTQDYIPTAVLTYIHNNLLYVSK